MLVYVTANVTNYAQINWISEYPHSPHKDYSSFGSLPDASLIGSYSLIEVTSSLIDKIWSAGRVNNTTTLYPNLGSSLVGTHWSREVDSEVDVVLSLNDDNLSTSWARINDTDIAPRRQL